MKTTIPAPTAQHRLSRDCRYEALLDGAAQLLREGGFNAVTMEAVAARAGVSRPLVYKHFPNREALLAGLWRREAAVIDASVIALHEVHGFEAIVRASIEAALGGLDRRSLMWAPWLHSELFDPEMRREQRARFKRIRAWWAAQVIDEFGLSQDEADAAVTMHLAGLDSMLADFRANAEKHSRSELVEVYVCLVMGGLHALRDRSVEKKVEKGVEA